MAFAKKAAGTAPAKKTSTATKAAAPALTAVQKAKLLLHKPPADMDKPFALELRFVTGKDGYITPTNLLCDRIKGRWDNENAKRFNMLEYDQLTVMGIVARLTAGTAMPNPLRRFTPNTVYGMFLRVRVTKEGFIATSLAGAYKLVAVEGRKAKKQVWLVPKEDKSGKRIVPQDLKLFRRAVRLLRGAFVNTQLPPVPVRGKKAAGDEDSDD